MDVATTLNGQEVLDAQLRPDASWRERQGWRKSDREESAEEASAGKISRSKGDGGLSNVIRRHTGERIRFFLLRTHYRSTIVYNEEGLQEAGASLEAFYRFFDRFNEITSLQDCPEYPGQYF